MTALFFSRLSVPTPAGFGFWPTVRSHGWCSLAPFRVDVPGQTLGRIVRLADGTTIRVQVTGSRGVLHVRMESRTRITRQMRTGVLRQIQSCLRLEENFAAFHSEARRLPRFRWIAGSGAGRMLRAPTAFEDTVKMICTTNCTWALTTIMTSNLVAALGGHTEGIGTAFPAPEAIAGSSEKFLRAEIKTGYRAPYILRFAELVASGRLDPEAWRTSAAPTDELFATLRTVKGVGPYAAGNILKLIGRYDYLSLDSWVRERYARLYHKGRRVKDATIERHYAPLGPWRGLFFWLEMTRGWDGEKFTT